jgi:uncharacterized protein (DUF305 family)
MLRQTSNRLIAMSAGLLLVSGCAMTSDSNEPGDVADPHAGHIMNGDSQQLADSGFSAMDVMFAQMMIPHHEQAIEMAELATNRALSTEVLELAAEIMGEQDPEIEQMKSWLSEAGASGTMDHDMGMDGMLSAEQMQALAAASGAEFDRLFLEGMILHHEGAIQMAQMVTGSKNAEAKALGEAIVVSQRAQIERMELLLAR